MKILLPALVLCLVAGGAAAQEIGRLFTTPAERQALERMRHGVRPPAQRAAAAVTAPDAAAAPNAASAAAAPRLPAVAGERLIVVNGMVRRSGSGRVTTWINSVPHTRDGSVGGGVAISQQQGARVALTLGSGRSVTLKPGQAVDAATGRVKEAYQPARPAPLSSQAPAPASDQAP